MAARTPRPPKSRIHYRVVPLREALRVRDAFTESTAERPPNLIFEPPSHRTMAYGRRLHRSR